MRQETSDHAVSSPADTRLLGRLDRLEEQLAKLTGIIEASTMGDQTAPENSIDSLSLKTTIQELLQKNQECEEQLTQCEAKMNQVDEVKSTVQEMKQNEHAVGEKLHNYEMRSSRKIDSMTERVDQFASVVDNFATNAVNSKLMCVDNSEKIISLTNQLEQKELQQKTTDAATKEQLEEITRKVDQQGSNLDNLETKQKELQQKTTDVATKAQLEEMTRKVDQQASNLATKAQHEEMKRRMDEQASYALSTDPIAFSCYRTSG